MTTCLLCGEPIDPRDERVWQDTRCLTACKRTRASGKRRDMSDRIVLGYRDEYAHNHCAQAYKAGRLNQLGLELR